MAKRLQVEVTIISAQDLKDVNLGCFGGKLSPVAVAWTTSSPARKYTLPSAKDGQHPIWNSRQAFLCGEDAITNGLESLTVELCHTSFIKKRILGTATVPLGSEYLSDAPKSVTSDVVLPSGMKQGVLNLSLKISDAPVPDPSTSSHAQSLGGGGGGACGGCGGGCGGGGGGC